MFFFCAAYNLELKQSLLKHKTATVQHYTIKEK